MSDEIPSGLPEDAPEPPPLGAPEGDAEGEGKPRRGEDAMPGLPTGGEPPASG